MVLPLHPADRVTVSTGSSSDTEANTRTPDGRPRTSGNGITRTLLSLMALSPATSLAVTQDDATSVPGSGCNSNERSTGEPNTTVPLPLPRDSAEAPAASAHNPGPKMVLRIFTINSVFRSEGFLHISPR